MSEPASGSPPIKYNDGITYDGWKDPIDTSFFIDHGNMSSLPGYPVLRPDPYQPPSVCNCDENFEIKEGTTLEEVVAHIQKEEEKCPIYMNNMYNIVTGKVKFADPEPFWETF